MGIFDFVGDIVGEVTGVAGGIVGQARQGLTGADPTINEGAFNNPYLQGDLARYDQMMNDPSRQGIGNDVYAQQQELAKALQDQAYGNAPSVAQLQLQEQSGRNIESQFGAAMSARGGNAGLMQRQAMQTGADIQNQTNRAGAQLRLQEQMAARNALAGQLTGMYSQQMNKQQMNDAYLANTLAARQNLLTNESNSKQALEKLKYGAASDAQKNQGDFVTKLGSAIATGGTM